MKWLPLLLLLFSLPLAAVDVRSFGAAGDGVADDSSALRRAVEKIKADGGGVLDFPAGTYRIGTLRGGMLFDGVSNVTVNFAPDAVLLMDNLEANGNGGGHGITFRAPAKNIELNNVHIKWAVKPLRRSSGDGLRFEGYPEESRTLSDIRLNNCKVEQSAQTGAVFMGCSGITVRNFTVENSWADGLHFNACRKVEVDGVTGIDTGDDTLAFVTYCAEKLTGKTGTVFSLPELGEWNNSNSTAVRIRSRGGRANGVRIAGADKVKLSDIRVEGKSSGIIIDAGPVSRRHRWQYFASRGIEIRDAEIEKCDTGFYVWQFNSSIDDDAYAKFEVNAENLKISGCTNDSVHLSGVRGVILKNFTTEGCRWRFRTFRDCSVENVKITAAPFLIYGDAGKVSPAKAETIAANDSTFQAVTVSGGNLELQNCRKLQLSDITVEQSGAGAFQAIRVFESSIRNLILSEVNQDKKENMIAARLLQCRHLQLDGVTVSGSPLAALLEIGGGNAELRSGTISIRELSGPPGVPPCRIQGGAFAPDHLEIR